MKHLLIFSSLAILTFADSINLTNGWNLIGFEKNVNIDILKSTYSYVNCMSDKQKCFTLFKYDNNIFDWKILENITKAYYTSNLDSIDKGDGVWIYNHSNAESMEFFESPTYYTKNIYNMDSKKFTLNNAQWYLIAVLEDKNLSTSTLPINFELFYKFDSNSSNWKIYANNHNTKSDLTNIKKGEAIWILNSGFDMSQESYRYIKISNIKNTNRNYGAITDINISFVDTIPFYNVFSTDTIYNSVTNLMDSNSSTEVYFANGTTLIVDLYQNRYINEINIDFRVDSYQKSTGYNIYLGDSFATKNSTTKNTNAYNFYIELSKDGVYWTKLYDSTIKTQVQSRLKLKTSKEF